MKTLVLVLVFFLSLSPAQAQVDQVKSLLNERKGLEAIQTIDAIADPLSAELQHLKALAILNMGDQAALDYLGLDPYPDDMSPEEQSQAVQQFMESHILPLVADAAQRGYTPAKVDLALLLAIDDDSISQSTLSLFIEAADEGYLPAELSLFSFYCSGQDKGKLDGERFSPIRILNSFGSIETDADDEPNYYHISGNVDDDQLFLRAIGTAAVSYAVGTCSEVNKEVAEATFDKLIQRPGGREAAASSFRTLLNLLEEDALWRPDTRNALSPDAALASEWKQFGLTRQLLSILSAVDLFDQSINGRLVQHHPLLARASLDEIIRLTKLEQQKDFSVWESALMSLFRYAESAAESKHLTRDIGYSEIIQEAMIFATDELHSEYPSYWRYQSIAEKFESGEAWPKDLAKAVHFYQKAAAIDDPFGFAAFRLGWHYSNVENTFADGNLAVSWYASAYEKGEVAAAYNNGLIFEFGKAIEKSDKNALFWYQKAADAGDADGMSKVGYFYDFGRSVPENDTTAYSWYIKAAELGDGAAQRNAGIMLMEGEGVPVNLVEAYKWLNLAQGNGIENARDIKNSLSQRMSRAQIQEAQRLSAAWEPKESVDDIQSVSMSSATSKSSTPAYDRSVVATIQQGLLELGYYQGTIDGLYGPMTASAIRQFQTDLDMEIDTTPSSDLALQIGAMLGMKFILDEDSQADSSSAAPRGSGSGFIVTKNGYVVTNAHVVAGCSSIEVQGADSAFVEDTDEFVDLALLKVSFSRNQTPLSLRSGRGIRLGDDVVVAGYPLSNILGNSVRVTTGSVSSLSGIGGDRTSFQISAPIQPGNSGGPVLDENADIVGVVVSKLDALTVASHIGDIPQNVNFAISLGMLKAFLDANGVEYPISRNSLEKTTTQIATIAERSTVQILCN